jgi:hypothetical protein
MALFYGVSLSYSDFLVHLLNQDEEFREAVLTYLHNPKEDADWRRNFGQYGVKDVIGDITGEPTGKASDMQCYDFLADAEIARVQQLKRLEQDRAKPSYKDTDPRLPMTIFEEFEIEHDLRDTHYEADRDNIYIGRRLEVYKDLHYQGLPDDLKDLHHSLVREFPQRKPGFIQGY